MSKKVCLYGILTAVCLCMSYVEVIFNFDFLVPGIKLGLSNCVCIILLAKGDFKGAFLVNITRILLSVLLFSAPSTLIYSLTGGILSLLVMSILFKIKSLSLVGFSIIGALVHNISQLVVAIIMLGMGAVYYLPILIISAVVCGFLTGTVALLIDKRSVF